MVLNKLDAEIATREFEYGEHTILVKISIEHTYLSNKSVKYGRSGRSYYRTVSVYAYPTEEYEENDVEDISYDAFNSTACQVRAEPYEPDITVPDDPTLSILQRLQVWFDDETTVRDAKNYIRKKKRKQIQERRIPSGSKVELSTQIEETVRPVLETVDTQYRVLKEDVEIDIEVSVERMAAEVSWVEVEDEMERLTTEIENISESV